MIREYKGTGTLCNCIPYSPNISTDLLSYTELFCDFFFRIIFSVATSSTSELDATIHWVPPAIICE